MAMGAMAWHLDLDLHLLAEAGHPQDFGDDLHVFGVVVQKAAIVKDLELPNCRTADRDQGHARDMAGLKAGLSW